MTLYLYAIVEPTASLPSVAGIGGHGLRLLVLDRVAAVVGELGGPIEPTEEHLIAHARVVDEVAAANDPVLPVRFGRGFHDVDRLVAALELVSPQLEERFRAVEGCVELGLHVAEAVAPQPAATRGSEYMRRRLGEVTRVAEIHATLAERAR